MRAGQELGQPVEAAERPVGAAEERQERPQVNRRLRLQRRRDEGADLLAPGDVST